MSGRKNFLSPYLFVDAESMGADVTSQAIDIQGLDNVSMQLNFTGTPAGVFEVQGSLDQENWIALTLSPTPVAEGAADIVLIDMNNLSFPYIRLFYDRTSGTGTLNGYVSAKML